MKRRSETLHPGLPLLLKRSLEKRERRARLMASLTARDAVVALGLGAIVLVLVLFGGR